MIPSHTTARHLIAAAVAAVTAAAAVGIGLATRPGPAPDAAPAASDSTGHGHRHRAVGPVSSGGPAGTVVVHAADELRATLTRLLPTFEEAFPGVRVAVEYGAGAEHAGHVRAGASVDVFVSADAAAVGEL